MNEKEEGSGQLYSLFEYKNMALKRLKDFEALVVEKITHPAPGKSLRL